MAKTLGADEPGENLEIRVAYVVPPVHESVVIEATALDPTLDRRNDAVYQSTLFLRDDQLFQTLNAGINAGQHEGGGKSLEIRRFGFNLDHGGVGGGLKVLVNNVQQNQGTQGHGQGYLGGLKSLTPNRRGHGLLNARSPQYGELSRLCASTSPARVLARRLPRRLQAALFDTFRTFLAYAPPHAASSFSARSSRTDRPLFKTLCLQART